MNFHFCDEAWDARYPCDVSTTRPDELAAATLAATQVVDALSGHQFGLCTITLRPCRMSCGAWPAGWSSFDPATWWNGTTGPWTWPVGECGTCGRPTCSCATLPEVALPYPVHDVVTVKVDGTPLATGAYRVDDNRTLVRVDGSTWPTCNDLTANDDVAGTWSVTARYGQDPPETGRYAVGEMTCEFLKAFAGQDCRVPRNVVELVRQGVRIKYGDVGGSFEKGKTGLWLVDAFVAAVNPNNLRRRATVLDVDAVVGRRAGT